jgi:hypothetical protein
VQLERIPCERKKWLTCSLERRPLPSGRTWESKKQKQRHIREHDKKSVQNTKKWAVFAFLQPEEETTSEWTDVCAHKKRGKAQRGSFSCTPPPSALPRSLPLSATPIRLPHATVARPQPIHVSAKAVAEQRPQSEAQNSGCRQPDGGTHLDVRTHPEKQEGHVQAGGGPHGQGNADEVL